MTYMVLDNGTERPATPEEVAEIEARAVVDIVAERAKLNTAINEWRAHKNFTTFPHAGKVIACDQLSRSDIDATAGHIALFGTFPPDFPGGWRAVDNTYVMMPTIDDFKAMYTSMTAQGTANFNQSQQFKAQMNAAQTSQDIAAVYAALEAN